MSESALSTLRRWAARQVERQLYALYDDLNAPGAPYDWQKRFHDLGSECNERAIIAGNRVGKTRTGAAECACHATGWYPKWWSGRRFDRPTDGIAAGQTNEVLRNVQQLQLVGPLREGERKPSGTGWIPADRIVDWSFRACGVMNVLDYVRVRHESGGLSTISFKSFEQTHVKFQGESKSWIWLDEEPDMDIFSECQMRVMDQSGLIILTRTPLYGLTDLIEHFMSGKPGTTWVNATWEDAPHMDAGERDRRIAQMQAHEVEARTAGVPMLGSGAVYRLPQSQYVVASDQFPPISRHWRRLCAMDFGIDHPCAALWAAHDPDTDIVWIYDGFKQSGLTAAEHASRIRQRGVWIPVAWPHDGKQRDKGSGRTLQEIYCGEGLNMLPVSARFDDTKGGAQSREAATQMVLHRMHSGTLKISSALVDLLEELRMLHRKDGKIVDSRDDLESTLRYIVMMLRYGLSRADGQGGSSRRFHEADVHHDPFSVLDGPGIGAA